MYKAVFLLLLLSVATGISFVIAAKKEKLEISTPVLAGSPIIVLNK